VFQHQKRRQQLFLVALQLRKLLLQLRLRAPLGSNRVTTANTSTDKTTLTSESRQETPLDSGSVHDEALRHEKQLVLLLH